MKVYNGWKNINILRLKKIARFNNIVDILSDHKQQEDGVVLQPYR